MHTEQTAVYGVVAEIIRDVAKVPVEQIGADKRIEEDLDLDSLAMVEVCVVAERRFGIEVPDQRAVDFVTVGDLVDFVEAALAAERG